MVRFAEEKDLDRGFTRPELDAWTFNQGALDFYEAVGFQTFRQFMELDLTEDK